MTNARQITSSCRRRWWQRRFQNTRNTINGITTPMHDTSQNLLQSVTRAWRLFSDRPFLALTSGSTSRRPRSQATFPGRKPARRTTTALAVMPFGAMFSVCIIPAAKKKSKQIPCSPTATAISGKGGRAEDCKPRRPGGHSYHQHPLHAPFADKPAQREKKEYLHPLANRHDGADVLRFYFRPPAPDTARQTQNRSPSPLLRSAPHEKDRGLRICKHF